MGNAVPAQPLPQGQQFRGGRAERPHMLLARARLARYAHARDHGLLVDVQSAGSLDDPLHGGTSMRMCAGARRSVLLTTLLGVLDGNNAGSRKLPRQFWPGLAIPNIIDVSGRRRAGLVAHFHGAGWAPAHHHFGEGQGQLGSAFGVQFEMGDLARLTAGSIGCSPRSHSLRPPGTGATYAACPLVRAAPRRPQPDAIAYR